MMLKPFSKLLIRMRKHLFYFMTYVNDRQIEEPDRILAIVYPLTYETGIHTAANVVDRATMMTSRVCT